MTADTLRCVRTDDHLTPDESGPSLADLAAHALPAEVDLDHVPELVRGDGAATSDPLGAARPADQPAPAHRGPPPRHHGCSRPLQRLQGLALPEQRPACPSPCGRPRGRCAPAPRASSAGSRARSATAADRSGDTFPRDRCPVASPAAPPSRAFAQLARQGSQRNSESVSIIRVDTT